MKIAFPRKKNETEIPVAKKTPHHHNNLYNADFVPADGHEGYVSCQSKQTRLNDYHLCTFHTRLHGNLAELAQSPSTAANHSALWYVIISRLTSTATFNTAKQKLYNNINVSFIDVAPPKHDAWTKKQAEGIKGIMTIIQIVKQSRFLMFETPRDSHLIWNQLSG